MKNSENNVDALNNLVFEKRNKSYGAYAIRQSYNGTAIKSTLITSGAFVALVVVLMLLGSSGTITQNSDDILNNGAVLTAKVLDLTPKQEIKPRVSASSPAARATNNYIVSNNAVVDTTIRFKEDANRVGMSNNMNANGTNLRDTSTVVPTNTTVVTPTVTVKAPVLIADKMPAFKGDMAKFIRDNIVFPPEALEFGVNGTVYVQFIVEEDGSIANLKVVKKLGLGCDEQAVNVIRKMPKWEPGIDKGEPVKVIFHLPIKFKTNN